MATRRAVPRGGAGQQGVDTGVPQVPAAQPRQQPVTARQPQKRQRAGNDALPARAAKRAKAATVVVQVPRMHTRSTPAAPAAQATGTCLQPAPGASQQAAAPKRARSVAAVVQSANPPCPSMPAPSRPGPFRRESARVESRKREHTHTAQQAPAGLHSGATQRHAAERRDRGAQDGAVQQPQAKAQPVVEPQNAPGPPASRMAPMHQPAATQPGHSTRQRRLQQSAQEQQQQPQEQAVQQQREATRPPAPARGPPRTPAPHPLARGGQPQFYTAGGMAGTRGAGAGSSVAVACTPSFAGPSAGVHHVLQQQPRAPVKRVLRRRPLAAAANKGEGEGVGQAGQPDV